MPQSASFFRRLSFCVAFLCLLASHAASWAAVEISFYSRELGGNNFPHAFVTLKGTPDAGGPSIDTSYGFTAKAVTPALLFGSVPGTIINETEAYIRKSERQFSLTLTDDQYRAVAMVIAKWRNAPQPSYNLNRANCVHFVGEVAEAAGLKVEFRKSLMKKPRSFLLAIKADNSSVLSVQNAATVMK